MGGPFEGVHEFVEAASFEVNALTIDVEDYWDVFSKDWLNLNIEPTEAVTRTTEQILEILDQVKVKATFFVLGTVAKKFPTLIRSISRAGHEIGSHGISHTQIFKLSREKFTAEVMDSKVLLEEIISTPVLGYRAPAFSIMPKTAWALDVLAQAGFKYDSSIFPIKSRRYGWPNFRKDICVLDRMLGFVITEVPMSVVHFMGRDWPAGGGGYLRHFPYSVTRHCLRIIQKNRPAVVYLHPYEIDTEDKILSLEHLSKQKSKAAVKHHKMQMRKRHTVKSKLTKLLSEFEFAPVTNVLEDIGML